MPPKRAEKIQWQVCAGCQIAFLWLACLLQGIHLFSQRGRSPRILLEPLGFLLISAAQRRKEKKKKKKRQLCPPRAFNANRQAQMADEATVTPWLTPAHARPSSSRVQNRPAVPKSPFLHPPLGTPGLFLHLQPPRSTDISALLAAGGLSPSPTTPVPVLHLVSANCRANFYLRESQRWPRCSATSQPWVPAAVPWHQGTAAAEVPCLCCG